MNNVPVNPSFPCKVIVFNIKNSLYGLKGFQRRNHYESTRKYWVINDEHRNNEIYEYVVGLVDGNAETAYKVNKWFPTKEKQYLGRYEFEGSETKATKELIGRSFYKQRKICMGYWQWGRYLIIEFDGNGKFRILVGQKDSTWLNC